MKSLPLPVRVAAGLVATAVEETRELPRRLVGLPVTVVSQVLQLTMRVQQQITELAIKGDEALAVLRPPAEEEPEWAVFDEDLSPDTPAGRGMPPARTVGSAHVPGAEDEAWGAWAPASGGSGRKSRDSEQVPGRRRDTVHRMAQVHEAGVAQAAEAGGPAGLADYDRMTLPQLRARLRRLSLEQLEELLDYERTHGNRSGIVSMLTNRIAKVRGES